MNIQRVTKVASANSDRSLIVKPDFSFTHNHYVPVIKSKKGELWALEGLKAASNPFVTPLVELHRSDSTPADHAMKVRNRLTQAWPNRPFFVDTLLWGVSGPQAVTAAQTMFQGMQYAKELLYVPVTGLGRSPSYQAAIGAAVAAASHGVVLRLRLIDFATPSTLSSKIGALLQLLKCGPEITDIVIDYGAQTDGSALEELIREHVAVLPLVKRWRTLTVAAGSFPSSLGGIPANQWIDLEREEWGGWQGAIGGAPPLARVPAFGDYGIRDTQPPPAFGSPAPNIRYTTDGSFLVRRGQTLVKNGGSDEIFPICASLAQRQEFRGADFSAGDAEIAERAENEDSPGNAGDWVAWGMSHHFETVVSEIQSPLAP